MAEERGDFQTSRLECNFDKPTPRFYVPYWSKSKSKLKDSLTKEGKGYSYIGKKDVGNEIYLCLRLEGLIKIKKRQEDV